MEDYIRIIPHLLLYLLHIAVNGLGVLAMSHYRKVQAFSRLENLYQRSHLVNEHVSRRGTHEKFYSRYLFSRHL